MSTEGARQAGLPNLSGKRTEKVHTDIFMFVYTCFVHSRAADFQLSFSFLYDLEEEKHVSEY